MPEKKKISVSEQLKKGAEEMRQVNAGKKSLSSFRTYKIQAFEKTYNAKSIKNLRRKFGISQRILSTGLGTSIKTVQSWESGSKKPSTTACRLLDALENCPPFRDYIFPDSF